MSNGAAGSGAEEVQSGTPTPETTRPKGRFAARILEQRDAMILDSLLACFAEHGCFETKIDQVIAEVGIGKGTLYRHYPSREDLFKAAVRRGVEVLRVRCQGIWEMHATDPQAALRSVIGELVALNHRDDPVSPATLARLSCGRKWNSIHRTDDQELEAAFLPLVRSWQLAGLIDSAADTRWVATLTTTLVNSSGLTSDVLHEGIERAVESSRDPEPPVSLVDRIVDVLLRAFSPTAPSDRPQRGSTTDL